METGNGNESLAELVDTIKGTIKNLENKRSFLEEQRPLYEQIFDRINSADTSEDSEETWQFGEVIFQGGKFFQNIGYDYYVEKSREECLEFIVVRINLIKEAIEQFEQKLNEARDTLKNMELLQKDADSLKGELLENEHGEQLMEIREELDEDGNVLNSSVTAANGPRKEGKAAPEQSDTSTQSDAKSDAPDSLDTVEEQESVNTEAHTTETEYLEDQNSFKISQEQMYTFDDLVEQLDKIDEDEDGEFDVNDVQYDYDAYEGINDEYVDYEDDDDDDDDDDYDYDYDTRNVSIVPEPAQKSFMDQINALRKKKMQEDDKQKQDSEATKSILKKTSGKKKSVNFAPQLDVYEVENVKAETKSNTFNFPRYNNIVSSDISETTTEDADFDADLFARMIGAKDADVLHDKYQQNQTPATSEVSVEPTPRKKRVSRFKREKQGSAASPLLERNTDSNPSPAVMDIVEHSDIQETVNDSSSAISDIVAREDIEPPSPVVSKQPNFFSKEMKSLRKPKKSQPPKPSIDLSESESSDENEDDPAPTEQYNEDKESSEKQPITSAFPKQKDNNVINQPKIDFSQLADTDDMARAYLLGLYDDDVEDPGMVLQEASDFNEYNKAVEDLKPELEQFFKENPQPTEAAQVQTADSGPMMNDIIERDPLKDMETSPLQDVQEQIIYSEIQKEYIEHRRRNIEKLAATNGMTGGHNDDDEEELGKEPIDEFGNPVTTSRFKEQTMAARKLHIKPFTKN